MGKTRFLWTLLLTASGLLTLCGCGSGSDPSGGSQNKPQQSAPAQSGTKEGSSETKKQGSSETKDEGSKTKQDSSGTKDSGSGTR